MDVRRNDTVVSCAVCGRTLLLGERAEAYRQGHRRGNVCLLCVGEAQARGWLREGAPSPPPLPQPEPRAPGKLSRMFRRGGDVAPAPARPVDEVRSPADDLDTVAREGVDAFNHSPYRRTVSGIAKSLGEPRVSIVALAGTRPDVIVTVAWEISWYQYRVDASATGVVKLEGRGDDLGELDGRWQGWNGSVERDGRLALTG